MTISEGSTEFYLKPCQFTYASEASSSLIKVSFTGGNSCLMFNPLTYGAESLSVSFNCPGSNQ